MAYQMEIKKGIFDAGTVVFDEESVIYNDVQMMFSEIIGFSYTNVTTDPRGREHTLYQFDLVDSSDDVLKIYFTGGKFMDDLGSVIYDNVIAEVWKNFGQRILNETIRDISKGQEWKIGDLLCNRQGIHFEKKGWFSKAKTFTIAWKDIDFETKDDTFVIFTSVDTEAFITVRKTEMNMHILGSIFETIKRDPQFANYLTGLKQFQY